MTDHSGKRFGKFILVKMVESKSKKARYLAMCDCGTERVVWYSNLSTGRTTSCGCSRAKHGGSKGNHPEYTVWSGMKDRCGNPKASAYNRYGGIGVKVCQRWADSYEAFLEDMGKRPSAAHSLDRINPNGNYEPLNCRWATLEQQNRNKRKSLIVCIDGVSKHIFDWAEEYGINRNTIRGRIRRGFSPQEAVTTKVFGRGRNALISRRS